MLWLEQGLYVKIVQLEEGPRPLPLKSGFSEGVAYRVLGCYNPAETSDAWYIFSNDRDETWFICNRHVRTVCLNAARADFRYSLAESGGL